MIPNVEQLLIVCGIAFAVVGLIIWLLVKIPSEDGGSDRYNNHDD